MSDFDVKACMETMKDVPELEAVCANLCLRMKLQENAAAEQKKQQAALTARRDALAAKVPVGYLTGRERARDFDAMEKIVAKTGITDAQRSALFDALKAGYIDASIL